MSQSIRGKAKPFRGSNFVRAALAPIACYYPFTVGLPRLDVVNRSLGAFTGAVSTDRSGISTASGQYFTGGSRRSFVGTGLTVMAEIELGDVATTGLRHIVGTVGDQFIRLVFNVQSSAVYVQSVSSVYIAGSLRETKNLQLTDDVTPARGDKFFIGIRFDQPSLRVFGAPIGQPLQFGDDSSYGAPIDDQGGAILVGKDDASSAPFDGKVNYVTINNAAMSDVAIAAWAARPWRNFGTPRRIWAPSSAPGEFFARPYYDMIGQSRMGS